MAFIFPKEYIKNLIQNAIKTLLQENKNLSDFKIDFDVEYKERSNFGDYASNVAFLISKELKAAPFKIAEKIKAIIESFLPEHIERIEIEGGGFLNFFFKKDYFTENLKILPKISQKNFAQSKKEKVIIEYSSPNVAKPMHIGHLRNTILGNALANLFEFLGYKVIRWNHIGDWGTQFGKLIASYKRWGNKEKIRQNPIDELLALYVKFHQELKNNPDLEKEGQEEFKKLENGDRENKKILDWFLKESLKEFNQLYKLLGIKKFDKEIGESFYSPLIYKLIKELKEKNLLEESQGALIIRLDKFNLPPALIQKTDGATLYMTRELASLKYRIEKYKPSKILYVVGNEQSLHFQQLFAIAQLMGINPEIGEHVKYELVLGSEGKKFSTRQGNMVRAKEVIDKAIAAAQKIVDQKRQDLSRKEREKIAQSIGINALKYYMLKESRMAQIVFNLDAMLSLNGNSAPYLNYTYARFSSILSKTKKTGKANFNLLKMQEIGLIKKMFAFQDSLEKAWQSLSPHPIASYLFELANKANKFYESTPILAESLEGRKNALIILVSAICKIMELGFEIIGIQVLDKI